MPEVEPQEAVENRPESGCGFPAKQSPQAELLDDSRLDVHFARFDMPLDFSDALLDFSD